MLTVRYAAAALSMLAMQPSVVLPHLRWCGNGWWIIILLLFLLQVFPKLDIRNVVEGTEEVTIKNWCGFGHSSCHHEFSVRPFRCLGIIIIFACNVMPIENKPVLNVNSYLDETVKCFIDDFALNFIQKSSVKQYSIENGQTQLQYNGGNTNIYSMTDKLLLLVC